MGWREKNLKNKMDAELKPNQRLWKINSGLAWQGKQAVIQGIKCLINLRPFRGAEAGLADTIGFDSIEITPEMVGKKIAVFVGSEIKASPNEKLSKVQQRFRDMVVAMGGIHREHRPDKVIETTKIYD